MIDSLLNISDLSKESLIQILDHNANDSNLLKSKNIGLIFEKNSTRTRLSFLTGISELGGNPIEIKLEDLNLSREESFEDTFRALSCYLDGLIFRTTDHKKLIKAQKFFNKPIINGLSNISHPCQILSDLYTLKEQFKSLALNILWIGDMNNVCFSLCEAVNILDDLNLAICTPKSISDSNKWKLRSNINIYNTISDLDLSKIDCVMTDVFISMNDENDIEKIKLLSPYIVNSDIMDQTSSKCVFMHCLPAKVGYEVSEDIFKGVKSIVWRQAYNRKVAQKNLLSLINW